MSQRPWQVAEHKGNWVDEAGELHHDPFLAKMLRVVFKHTEHEYVEFAVGAGDAQRLRALLNREDRARSRLLIRGGIYAARAGLAEGRLQKLTSPQAEEEETR